MAVLVPDEGGVCGVAVELPDFDRYGRREQRLKARVCGVAIKLPGFDHCGRSEQRSNRDSAVLVIACAS